MLGTNTTATPNYANTSINPSLSSNCVILSVDHTIVNLLPVNVPQSKHRLQPVLPKFYQERLDKHLYRKPQCALYI